jgi:hypothetical protein
MKILFFITGFRQLKEYEYQAIFLKKCSLINVLADVYIHCNNPEISERIVTAYQSLPIKNKRLLITTKNEGFKMGLVEALADSFHLFAEYDYVIHCHPDVFLVNEQPFVEMLMNNLSTPDSFLVSYSFPNDPTFFSTDLFIFKPKLLKINIFLDELYTWKDIPEHWLSHILKKNEIPYKIVQRFSDNYWHPRRIDMLGFWHEHELERIEEYIKSKT